MKYPFLIVAAVLVGGCSQKSEQNQDTKEIRVVANDSIPFERTDVNPAPIASYEVKVPDELNKFVFSIKLYETPLRFRYRSEVKYKVLDVTDSIDLPNFGIQPKVDVRKYQNDLSAMIGFYDADGNFKELKKVEVINNQLKMKQVKRYGVGTVRK